MNTTLRNIMTLAEKLEDIMFLEREDAEKAAEICAGIKYEVLRASGVPVWSCSGKVIKGSSFYSVKVVPSIDTSG